MAHDLVLSFRSVVLYPEDIASLRDGCWINDNIISFWLEVIEQSSDLPAGRRITFVAPAIAQMCRFELDPLDLEDALKGLNLAHSEAVFVPISDNSDPGSAAAAAEVALALSRLVDPGASDPTRAASVVEVACSQQRNGYDCGLYVLGYCDRVARLLAGDATVDPEHDGPLREALASAPDAAGLRRRIAAKIECLRRSP